MFLTTLAGCFLAHDIPERRMLRGWLDSWSGVGHVVEAMHELGYDARRCWSPFRLTCGVLSGSRQPAPQVDWHGVRRAPWRACGEPSCAS